MATYYMRADGTAANKGAATGPASSAAACMSIATHNGETFSAGDIIYLSSQGGDYDCSGINLIPPSSGSSGSPIVYQTVSGETPILDADGGKIHCCYIADKSYITIDGITFKNATSRMIHLRALNSASTGFVIENCTFNGTAGGIGIDLYVDNEDLTEVTIDSCTFDTMDDSGIRFFHGVAAGAGEIYNVTISHCTFDTLTAVGSCRGIGTDFSNLGNALAANRLPYGITIQNNTFSGTNASAIHLYCKNTASNLIASNTITGAGVNRDIAINAIQLHACDNLVVEYNDVSNTGCVGPGDGCGIILDWANSDPTYITENTIVRYNYCHDNDDTNAVGSSGINAYRAKNCEIYYNVCSGNNRGMNFTSDAGNPSTGNVFYNNTIVNNVYDGVELVAGCPTSTWTNNIIANNGAEGVDDNSANDPTFTYNCLYNNTGGNYSGFTLGAGCIELDPKFKSGSDYLLQPNSPCKDKGDKSVWTGTANIKDYAGNRITNAGGQIVTRGLKVSMGANQHQYNKSIRKPILSTILKKLKFMR